MARIRPHAHSFAAAQWPFADPVNTTAFTTAAVEQGLPILLVVHDHDGDWQFLDDAVDDDGEGLPVCLGCVFDRDRSLAQLAKMPRGWLASRGSPAAAWELESFPDDDTD
jgi:hypothetical protein